MAEPANREKPKPDFRLMDLDYWCRRQMISHWNIRKQTVFSHCSKESFKLVKSLNQKPKISIQLDGPEWITVSIGDEAANGSSQRFRVVDNGINLYHSGYVLPINFGLSARDAFVHLCEMYHHKELTIYLDPESKTPVGAVRNVLDGFPINTIINSNLSDRRDDEAYIKNALEFLLPSKTLFMSKNPYYWYQDLRDKVLQFEYENLILQNLKEIDLVDLKSIHTEVSITPCCFQIGRRLITTQHFQGFIRKWIKSEIYPKFKTMLIHSWSRDMEEDYQQKVLNGLVYQQLPNDGKHKHRSTQFIFWTISAQVDGIYEVHRESDGQKAVICFESWSRTELWKFSVV